MSKLSVPALESVHLIYVVTAKCFSKPILAVPTDERRLGEKMMCVKCLVSKAEELVRLYHMQTDRRYAYQLYMVYTL